MIEPQTIHVPYISGETDEECAQRLADILTAHGIDPLSVEPISGGLYKPPPVVKIDVQLFITPFSPES